MTQETQIGALYQPRGVGWGGRWEEVQREGIYVYLWLNHVEVWQNVTKFCKAIILQLKNKLKKKENLVLSHLWVVFPFCFLFFEQNEN